MAKLTIKIQSRPDFDETFEVTYPGRFKSQLVDLLAIIYGCPTGAPKVDWLVQYIVKTTFSQILDMEVREKVHVFETKERDKITDAIEVSRVP